PLRGEKLRQIHNLTEEQLNKKRLIPTNSPWNFLNFKIKKSSGKWRLLHDLREANNTIEPMGPLQAGLPSPDMLPAEWRLIILDICADCFFNIYLHPDDAHRFAFTVPAVNAAEPSKRFHWAVLPQGMKNSPSICRRVVSNISEPVRSQFPETVIFHYIDDILITAPNTDKLAMVHKSVKEALCSHGLEVAPEKEQKTSPWKYLGLLIDERTFRLQTVTLFTKINAKQSLLGNINWICSFLGLSTVFLTPLFQLL
ncbi:POK8 protein, partial [Xiphorhynchus elegans]|nr:POK8 protein [Xiphorhynchus elegans]